MAPPSVYVSLLYNQPMSGRICLMSSSLGLELLLNETNRAKIISLLISVMALVSGRDGIEMGHKRV